MYFKLTNFYVIEKDPNIGNIRFYLLLLIFGAVFAVEIRVKCVK